MFQLNKAIKKAEEQRDTAIYPELFVKFTRSIKILKAIKTIRKYSYLLWTEQEINFLIEETKKGTPVEKIAKMLNHKVEDCLDELKKRNLLPKQDDDLSDSEIFEDILDKPMNE